MTIYRCKKDVRVTWPGRALELKADDLIAMAADQAALIEAHKAMLSGARRQGEASGLCRRIVIESEEGLKAAKKYLTPLSEKGGTK